MGMTGAVGGSYLTLGRFTVWFQKVGLRMDAGPRRPRLPHSPGATLGRGTMPGVRSSSVQLPAIVRSLPVVTIGSGPEGQHRSLSGPTG